MFMSKQKNDCCRFHIQVTFSIFEVCLSAIARKREVCRQTTSLKILNTVAVIFRSVHKIEMKAS